MGKITDNIFALLKDKLNLVLFIIFSSLILGSYYLAIVKIIPFESFLKSNSTLFIILQILFSITNAVLAGLSITMIVELFKKQKSSNNLNIAQTVLSLLISIGTSGCYICGSILVPSFGIASSFASLPFGGVEIKIITMLLLIYSINDLNNKLNGTCKIYRDSFVILLFENMSLKFNLKYFLQLKPAVITFSMIFVIFALPLLFSASSFNINDPKIYSCNHSSS